MPYQLICSLVCVNELINTLTDFKFIEAKCDVGMINSLIEDYNHALRKLSENIKDNDMIEINTNRFNKIKYFYDFIISEIQSLNQFSSIPYFIIQTAYNHSISGGLVSFEAKKIIDTVIDDILILNHSSFHNFKTLNESITKSKEITTSINCVSLSHDGMKMITSSDDSLLRIWNIETGLCEKTLEGHNDLVNSLNFTPDGKLVVSGSRDNTLRVWDLQTGECLKILYGHSNGVSSVSVTPDGKLVVSGSYDNTLRVWDLQTGECLKILYGHSNGVSSVSVTPDGKLVVSGSYDNTLRVWVLQTGECLKILEGHTNRVTCISITPEGKKIISGDADGNINIWES